MLRTVSGISESVHYDLVASGKSQRSQLQNLGSVATLLLLISAVLIWAASLEQIDLQKMDDTGLISVLPYSLIFALILLQMSFGLAISQRPLSQPLVLLHIVALIFMIYGITAIVQEVPRFAIGWKLAGIIDYIIQTGTVDGKIDAFFNWPTIFVLMAFVTELTGVDSAVSFMAWAPVFFNLLYLGPLWMIFRSATLDKRLIFLGLWFFYLANWIGQDYLSPQAFNYFFYMVILAIILTWLRGEAWQSGALLATLRCRSTYLDRTAGWIEKRVAGYEKPVTPSTPTQRAALVVLLVLLCMIMVSGHQLTPFATLGAISALVIFNRCTVLTLPILLGVLIATWVMFMATPYLSGHIHHVAAPVGSVGTNIDANLTERFRGSPGHIFVNYMRSGMSLFVWGLAFLGGLRRFRNGYRDRSLLVVAMSPFPLLLLQAYGGELLLRIYLYSVPFMVFFAAALFFPAPYAGHRLLSQVALYSISVLLIIGFFITRYGNERMTYFTAGEVAAVRYLYEHAEPGSQLIAATGTLPWRFQDYRSYKYTTVPAIARDSDIDELVNTMGEQKISCLLPHLDAQPTGIRRTLHWMDTRNLGTIRRDATAHPADSIRFMPTTMPLSMACFKPCSAQERTPVPRYRDDEMEKAIRDEERRERA